MESDGEGKDELFFLGRKNWYNDPFRIVILFQ